MNNPCRHCGTTYSHTDTTGCCSGCGRIFSGLAAFERHRVNLRCRDVETAVRMDGSPLFSVKRSDKGGDLWRLADRPGQTGSNPRARTTETDERAAWVPNHRGGMP